MLFSKLYLKINPDVFLCKSIKLNFESMHFIYLLLIYYNGLYHFSILILLLKMEYSCRVQATSGASTLQLQPTDTNALYLSIAPNAIQILI